MSDPPLAPRAALRWSVVRAIVAGLAPRTILELGCGLGAVGVRLARVAAYTAAEPDAESCRVARGRIAPLGGTVIHGDHTAAPSVAGYDLVCAFEVLEHIADDAAALADWLALVRPGGHLLLSVPAGPERFGRWDELVGHYRRYTGEQLRGVLAGAGGVDVRVVHYAWPLGYLLEAVRDRLARPGPAMPAGAGPQAAGRDGAGRDGAGRDGAGRDGAGPPGAADVAGTVAGTAADAAGGTAAERTGCSGRVLQPRRAVTGALIRAGVAPFVLAQRLRPDRGTGLVAVATRPR